MHSRIPIVTPSSTQSSVPTIQSIIGFTLAWIVMPRSLNRSPRLNPPDRQIRLGHIWVTSVRPLVKWSSCTVVVGARCDVMSHLGHIHHGGSHQHLVKCQDARIVIVCGQSFVAKCQDRLWPIVCGQSLWPIVCGQMPGTVCGQMPSFVAKCQSLVAKCQDCNRLWVSSKIKRHRTKISVPGMP